MWHVEKGYYKAYPRPHGGHENLETFRVWRFIPPPWELIFETPDLELAERVVEAHNKEINLLRLSQ